jgi:hypothetical protein
VALTPILPKASARVVTAAGLAAAEWYDFFRLLRTFAGDNEGVLDAIAELERRVLALEEADDDTARLIGPLSVRVTGSLADGVVQFFLLGDVDEPGNTYFYGTGPDGVKGFFAIADTIVGADSIVQTVAADGVSTFNLDGDEAAPGASKVYGTDGAGVKGWQDATGEALNPYADYLTDPDGNYLTDPDGNYLVSQDGYPIPLAYGGTGGDYESVLANLIFASPDSLAGAPIFRAMALDDLPSGGTSGQFLRGDRSYSNEIMGTVAFTIDGGGGGALGQTLSKYSNDAAAYQLRFQKARGTLAVPAAVQAGDALLSFQGRGYYATGGTPTAFSGNVGAFEIVAAEGFTNAAQGTYADVATVPVGSTTRASRLTISDVAVAPGTAGTEELGTTALPWERVSTVDLATSGTLTHGGALTPAQITANQNDYAPTGHSAAYHFRLSTDASRTITSLSGPSSGREILITNVGSFDLVLEHASASGTAANRFLCPGSANLTLNPNDSVRARYDGTSSRWRPIGT